MVTISSLIGQMYPGGLRVGGRSFTVKVWEDASLLCGLWLGVHSPGGELATVRLSERELWRLLRNGGAAQVVDWVQESVRALVRLLTFPAFRLSRGPRRLSYDLDRRPRPRSRLRVRPW